MNSAAVETPVSILDDLNTIEQLPTLPVVAKQVLTLAENPRSNMAQIAQVISRDQAISARVIRLVNSAFYGLSTRVGSIHHAIVVLGLTTVKNLVVGVSIVKTFEDSANISIFDRQKFWLHSFGCARTAKKIAEASGRPDPENFFLAGLLHDMGILILDQFFHEKFVTVLDGAVQKTRGYLEGERAVFGMNHGEVGAFLAEKWSIPVWAGHAMRYHHSPLALADEALESSDVISVIHVADCKSTEVGIGADISNFKPKLEPSVADRVGVPGDTLDEIVERVRLEVKDLIREWGL